MGSRLFVEYESAAAVIAGGSDIVAIGKTGVVAVDGFGEFGGIVVKMVGCWVLRMSDEVEAERYQGLALQHAPWQVEPVYVAADVSEI